MLLYHAGEPWAIGGFLGVDTFFVLSGFLITTLLVTEWTRRGGINLRAFWLRRAKRLLPALFVVMVGIVVYAGVFAAPGEVDRIRLDSLSTLGYFANWRFIFSGQSYFDQFSQPSPLRHMWSLAIEEQFYLVWPLIVCFLLWWRRSLRVLIGACIVMAAASAAWMAVLYQPGHDPSRVYYGTDTRVQSLLIGAVVGVLLFQHGPIRTWGWRLALRAAAFVGAGYTLWLFWRMSERTDDLYRGGFLLAALAVSAVIASVIQPDRGVLGHALSFAPLRWIGRISYGLYLWHWPVYLTLTPARIGVSGTSLLFLRLAVSFAFATASYYVVEKPIRRGTLHLPKPRALVPIGVAVLVVAIFATTTGGSESNAAITTRALQKVAASAASARPPAQPKAKATTGAGANTGTSGVVPAVPAPPTKVLLVGDSVAGTLGLGFPSVGRDANLWVWDRGRLGCGLFTGGEVVEGGELTPVDPNCDWTQHWPSDLQQFKPDVVVLLVGAWDILDRKVGDTWYKFGTVGFDQSFVSELDAATTLLGSTGAKVIVLTTPFFSRPDLAIQTGRQWPEYDPVRVDRLNALYRDFAVQHPGRYTILDLNKFVSPDGKFTSELNGVQIRDDGVHFTEAGAEIVDRWLAPQIKAVASGKDPDPSANEVHYDPRKLRKE